MIDLVEYFSVSMEILIWFFPFEFVNMKNYNDYFSSVKPTIHFWDKCQLDMMDFICWNLVQSFYVYCHEKYCSMVLFLCFYLGLFQASPHGINLELFASFNFLELIVHKCLFFFLMCLVYSTSEIILAWCCLCGKLLKYSQFL